MAGKDKERFIFFKYVPPKKGEKPWKGEEYGEKIDTEVTETEGLMSPGYGMPGHPGFPMFPEEPECPELPEMPEFPELPEPPECPELPELPEFPAGPCPENAVMHVIQGGDTFWKLAKKYGITVEAIAAANPNVDPLNLQVGETVCVPAGIPGAKG